nr:MFS transporter [Candidatus Sigynarchaeota archaeon]
MGIAGSEREFWIGMVASGYGMIYFISPFLLGRASDKIGRRNSVLIAMAGFITINIFVICFATHPLHLMIALACVGFCFGFVFPVLEAFMSEISEPFGQKFHARKLSVFMISWSIGLTLGPFIGGIFELFSPVVAFGYLIIHAILFATIMITLLPSTARLKQHIDFIKDHEKSNGDQHIDEFFSGMSKKKFRFFQIALFLLPVIYAFTSQIYVAIFPAYGEKFVAPGVLFNGLDSAVIAGFLIFSMGIGRTITFWHAGRLGSKGKTLGILIMPIGMATSSLVIFLVPIADIILPSIIIFGLCSGYCYAIGFILLMELTRKGKGMKAGIYEAANGAGALASTLIATFVGQLNPAFPYLLAAVFAASTGIVILGLYRWQQGQGKK